MATALEAISSDASLGQVFDAVSRTRHAVFPVMDKEAGIIGVIRLSAIRGILRELHVQDALIASDVMQPLEDFLTPEDSLAQAWERLLESADDEVLVIDGDPVGSNMRHVIGLVRRADVVKLVRWR